MAKLVFLKRPVIREIYFLACHIPTITAVMVAQLSGQWLSTQKVFGSMWSSSTTERQQHYNSKKKQGRGGKIIIRVSKTKIFQIK